MQSNVCKHISDSRQGHLFSSAQCLGYSFEFGELNDELCFPSKITILNQVKRAVKRLGAVAVFVASDYDAMIGDFEKMLKPTVRCRYLMFCVLCRTDLRTIYEKICLRIIIRQC